MCVLSCKRRKKEKRKKKCVRRKNKSRRWREDLGERDWTESGDEDLRVKHARIIVSGDKNVPLFLFLSLAPFFFLPCFFFSFFLFLLCGTPPRINFMYCVCVRWQNLSSFFCCAVVPFEKKEKIPLCNVFVCARSLLFHSNDSEKIWGCENEEKKGVIFVLVSVFISLIKELSSLLECHARILCLFCNVQGRVSFSFFQKKKEKGRKQASCNYVLFVLLLCSYFCMWMMMYCAMW